MPHHIMHGDWNPSPALDKFRIIAFSFTLALERGLLMAACKQRVAAFLLSKLWLENSAATHTDTHVLCVGTHVYVYTLHTSWSYLEPFFLSYLRMFFVSVTNLQSQFYREYLNRNRYSNSSSVSYVIGHHAELLKQKITSSSIHKKRKKKLSYMNAFDYHSFYEVRSHSIILKISEFTEM